MPRFVQHITIFIFAFAMAGGGHIKLLPAQNAVLLQAEKAFSDGEYRQAVSLTEKILESDSANYGARQILAASNLALMNFSKTIQTAEKGLELNPEAYPLIWFKSEALLQQGQLDEALPGYQKLLSAGSNIPENDIRLRMGFIYQSLGGQQYMNDRFEAAETNFRKAKTYMPDSLASYSNLTLTLMQQQKWEEALAVADEGRELYPEDETLRQMRMNILFERRDFTGMLNEYGEIYERNPADLENGIKYAELLLAQNQSEQSEKVYAELLERYPQERKIYTSLAGFFKARGNYPAQRSALRRMQQAFPDDAGVMRKIAASYTEEKDWTRARAALDSAAVFGGDVTEITALKADTYLKQDNLDAAIQTYEESLLSEPDNTELLFLKAAAEEKAAAWQNAEQTYQKLKNLFPEARVHKSLGRVYLQLNNKKQALASLEEAENLNPKDAWVNQQLAFLYLNNGEKETAFNMAVLALKLALKEMETFQENLSLRFQEQSNLAAYETAAGMRDEAEIYSENERVVNDAFNFITGNYDREAVMPLMAEMKTEYPLSGRLFYMISGYYLKTDKKEEGIEMLKESVTLAPRLPEAQLALGEYYEGNGEFVPAFTAFERVITSDPGNRDAYKNIIKLHRDNDRLDELCDRWKQQYRVNPQQPLLREYLIEALHKANRYKEAEEIIKSGK